MKKRIKSASSDGRVNNKIYHLLSSIGGYCCCRLTDVIWTSYNFILSLVSSCILGWRSWSSTLNKVEIFKVRKLIQLNSGLLNSGLLLFYCLEPYPHRHEVGLVSIYQTLTVEDGNISYIFLLHFSQPVPAPRSP